MTTALHVMSDLHTELMSDSEVASFLRKLRTHQSGVDALVLAGDIGNLAPRNQMRLRDFLGELSQLYPNVIYVPGNHEFWGISIEEGQLDMRTWLHLDFPRNVDVYESFKQATDGFGGSTLWYPDCGDELQKKYWCDYGYISDGATKIHEEHNAFLKLEELPEITVTHHYPTAESIAPHWAGSPMNVFFCAYMDEWLKTRKTLPKLWIHGHTHDPMDYVSKFGFRVYCNPYGYRNEKANPNFWERLEVTV